MFLSRPWVVLLKLTLWPGGPYLDSHQLYSIRSLWSKVFNLALLYPSNIYILYFSRMGRPLFFCINTCPTPAESDYFPWPPTLYLSLPPHPLTLSLPSFPPFTLFQS